MKIALMGAFFILPGKLLAEDMPRFGPFEAIAINSDVIRGVKVDETDKIWLLLNPLYKEMELKIKISQKPGDGYRKWFTGNYELISPANQGKAANEWADWLRTDSNFIEYWMDGNLILHLRRAE